MTSGDDPEARRPTPRTVRLPFRVKLALLTSTFAAVPLAVVGWLLVDVNEREAESSIQSLQIALTDRAASETETALADTQALLGAIARTLGDARVDEDARLSVVEGLLAVHRVEETVAIYDAEGRVIDRLLGADPTPTPDTLPAALRGRTIERTPSGSVLVAAPIHAAGRVTGYVATPLPLGRLREVVLRASRAQLASDEGVLLVVDEARRPLVDPGTSRTPLALPASLDLARLPDASTSGEGAVDGRAFVYTVTPVAGVPWAAVAQVPRDVVYAPIAKMRRIVIGTIALALLAAFAAALFFARRIAAPIGALVAFTKELAARRFGARVRIDTTDELGLLGDALSDAARELEASEARVREEEAIRSDLGRYLPAELVEQVIRREQSMELGGQRRAITVLFADVVAFTPLSDRLPPEQVVTLLNELFTLLTEAVFRHGGTVDKFVGDCVMALFGAPAPHADHARRAIRTAQDMLRFLESANAGWKEQLGVEVQLAIGVSTGEAVVGNVGSQTRMEYTAIGDVVNVAARLEAIARPGQILVTRATRDALGDRFEATRVGEREVPGRAAPVELFEVRW